ncbi:HyaD/HybD family hydrogenase maturation endopeptidase [Motiliproteus coralliicola]|uniref:HyaD/HybD family hydrogenase maturation endopeptidase n=1 Tax=Motiliproteus coralliicola TaxID=2283196 RepID=A0A369WCQ7_9GAMM|nr:HyaD/HybD family hydrogenase maturation endopeptidase [Motiliproteus coralliicola]RDE19818.1 HyaD/HybD family hydrogenase maturation endopeptidase [Motiliproteus coralliicola]
MSVLVLGVGNILLTDEGIGVRTIEALLERYHVPAGVELLDGGTAGMELMEVMARREHVILLDAVNTGAEPGTVVTLEEDEVPALFRSRISPHQLGISDLLGVMSLTGELPNHFTLFGVVPYSMETGTELSEPMVPKLEQMVELVFDKLEAMGLPLIERGPDEPFAQAQDRPPVFAENPTVSLV